MSRIRGVDAHRDSVSEKESAIFLGIGLERASLFLTFKPD